MSSSRGVKEKSIVSEAVAQAARSLRRLSLNDLDRALRNVLAALEAPGHSLDKDQFAALLQWLHQRLSVSAEEIVLLGELRASVRAARYPKPIEQIVLLQLSVIEAETDTKARDKRLDEVRRHLMKQPGEVFKVVDANDVVRMPAEGKLYMRPERWGRKVDVTKSETEQDE